MVFQRLPPTGIHSMTALLTGHGVAPLNPLHAATSWLPLLTSHGAATPEASLNIYYLIIDCCFGDLVSSVIRLWIPPSAFLLLTYHRASPAFCTSRPFLLMWAEAQANWIIAGEACMVWSIQQGNKTATNNPSYGPARKRL
jgi:hypothetical protein